LLRSGESEVEADLAEMEAGSERWSRKDCTPGSLQALRKAAALINSMCRGVEVFSDGAEGGGFCKGSQAVLAEGFDVEVGFDPSRLDGRNIILPNTQSIIGL